MKIRAVGGGEGRQQGEESERAQGKLEGLDQTYQLLTGYNATGLLGLHP